MKKNIVLFIILTLAYSLEAGQKDIVYVGDEKSEEVVFTGLIVLRDFWGPPNYGENPEEDKKETFYVMILQDEILVDIKGIIKIIKEVQLIFEAKTNINIDAEFVYTIKGNLLMAQSGHHHTEIVFLVSELR